MLTFAQKSKPALAADPSPRAKVHPTLSRASYQSNHSLARLLSPATAARRFARDPGLIPGRAPAILQSKLQVNTPGDAYEQEADRVAERVMRMPEPQLRRTGLQARRVQATDAAGMAAPPAVGDVLRSSGQPLDPATRAFMEPRFGRDFGNVRTHTGSQADTAAASLQARAFTVGRDVVFAAGEHNPGSESGKRLLAHELTHVVQQSASNGNHVQSSPRMPSPVPVDGRCGCQSCVQRKIIIGGKPYSPDAKYYQYLKTNFGDAMVEFISGMDNGGKPPSYSFDSNEQMGREVRVRAAAIKGMEEVHKGCCNYAPAGKTGYLDSAYWDKQGSYQFTLKTKLPAGKQPSDAVEAIFKPAAGTLLECNSTMVAIQYRAMLTLLGAAAFNKKFAGGAGLIISPHHVPPAGVAQHPIWSKGLYKEITITGEKDLLPGDWVYFKNIADYIDKHPGGAWSGEHAMYLGNHMFRGFGVKAMSQADLDAELLSKYNDGLLDSQKKKSVPGLQSYARRPVIGAIEK
jgi:hypothetical protein